MKAYFIGGSADLTCRRMVDDPHRTLRQVRSTPMPLPEFGKPPPESAHIVYEHYRRYDLPDATGKLIAVYIFQGDDDPFKPDRH